MQLVIADIGLHMAQYASRLGNYHRTFSSAMAKASLESKNSLDSCSDIEPVVARITSRYSNINSGLDPEQVEVRRTHTRETLKSQIDSIYVDPPLTVDGVDRVNDDGAEYEGIDPELVTWDGPDDPHNPRNWTRGKKVAQTFYASLFLFIPPVTSTIMSPAVGDILATFDNHNLTVGALMVSIMLIAWSIFILVCAPLSEVYGRYFVLNLSLVWGCIFDIACAVAPNSAAMLCFRFIGGIFNGAPLAVAAGTIADMFDESSRMWPLAILSIAPSSGPAIAPIISGFVVEKLNWRWVFWICAIMTGAAAIVCILFYRETYAPVLLARKAAKLRKETGNQNLHTIWEVDRLPLHVELRKALIRPIMFICTHPIVFFLGLHMAFVYGFMYLMIVAFPTLWEGEYGYSKGITGLMYLSLLLGLNFGIALFTPLMNIHNAKMRRRGKWRPEEFMFYMPLSTLLMSVGLFWFGWSAQYKLMWLMPEIGVFLFGVGLFVVFQAIQSYLVILNTRLASSIIGASVIFRTTLGGTFPLFGRAFYAKLDYGWANSICGFLILVLGLPPPLFIYFYGDRVRRWVDARYVVK